MNNKPATRERSAITRFMRIVRGSAEASLAGLAFACAILLLGMPIAFIVSGVHDGLSWLVARQGNMSVLTDAFVPVASVTGGLAVMAFVARLLVRFFHWRRMFRVRVIGREIPNPLPLQRMGGATA
jgi:hypothetical protein